MTITDILTDKVLVKSVQTAAIQPDGAQLARIGGLTDQGEIKAHVGPVFPLTPAKLAYARTRHGLRRGKIAMAAGARSGRQLKRGDTELTAKQW